jgi:hypothetical protein
MNKNNESTTTCITNCLVCVYSENPTDFPLVRFLITNLVLANATSHTQNRCHTFENKNIEKNLLTDFNVNNFV